MDFLKASFVFAVLLLLGCMAPSGAYAQDGEGVRGFVRDAETGTGLFGANVVLATLEGDLVSATSTGSQGTYRIGPEESGTYLFRVSFIGYSTYTDTLRLGSSGGFLTKSVSLSPTQQELEGVTVEAEGGSADLEAGRQQVRVADIERIPTPGATGDIASYLQTIPGVVSVGDRGGQLFVRGGTPSQNLVLMDGVMVYNPFHLIGFYSVFSEDLVQSAEFYAGGFGAEYNDRISSVLDVTMRPGNKKQPSGSGSASPFLMEAKIEVPLSGERLSVIASARQSIIDQTATGYLTTDVPLEFSDYYVKVHDVGQNSRCSFSGLSTSDEGLIDPEAENVFSSGNTVIGGQCIVLVPETSLLVDITTGYSRYDNRTETTSGNARESSIYRIHTDVAVSRPLFGVEWSYGAGVKINSYSYSVGQTFGVIANQDDYLYTFTGFTSLDMNIGWLALKPGVSIVYPTTYSPSIEPRVRGTMTPWGNQGPEINFATGLYRQTFEGISDERDAGSVFTAWVPAPLENERAQAIHGVLGVTHDISPALTASVETYYKALRSIPVPTWSVLSRFTTTTTLARGNVVGADARLTYERGKFYAFLGYGVSRVQYEAEQDDFGGWFGGRLQSYKPPHDQRHRLNTSLSYDFSLFEANVNWQFSTGLPYTQIYGFDTFIDVRGLEENPESDLGAPRFIFDRPYGDRLPVYHRLDVSLSKSFNVGLADFDLSAGAINVYDRRNIFYFDLAELRRVNQLPVVPYLGLKVEL